ncbi:MAG: SM-like, degradation of cytoplasmic mRNAs and positively regulates transcription initiation [Caeruleum heppii]|nr:MAG: SM-like, degradation of cytoplasmic mRNAs and positively regulates transcription initiation [Caeruleum heppii]
MERLSLHDPPALPTDTPPNLGPPLGGPPPPVAQLPPQMFTTAAQLLDLTDTNLVLQDTIERVFVRDVYADIPRGIFIVRGENVLLLGEIVCTALPLSRMGTHKALNADAPDSQDLDKDDDIPPPYKKAPMDRVFAMQKQEQKDRKRTDKKRLERLQALGFEGENQGEVLL